MRTSFLKTFLLTLVALLYAGTAAGAKHYLTVEEITQGPYSPSDTLEVDIWLDTGQELLFGFEMYVDFVPAVLSANEGASVRYPITGEEYSSFYLRADPPDLWYIRTFRLNQPPMGPVDQAIATLVFHVIDDFTETVITPYFNGPWNNSYVGVGPDGTSAVDKLPELEISPLTVPEPAATALVLSAIGTLALLWARGRRVR